MTREEFKSLSKEKQKKIIDSISPEDMRVLQKRSDMLTKEGLPLIMRLHTNKNDLNSYAQLSDLNETYCKEFNCSPSQFIEDLRAVETMFIEKSIEMGIGFNEKNYDIPKKYEKKNRNNYGNTTTGTNSIGDILKSKGIEINNETK